MVLQPATERKADQPAVGDGDPLCAVLRLDPAPSDHVHHDGSQWEESVGASQSAGGASYNNFGSRCEVRCGRITYVVHARTNSRDDCRMIDITAVKQGSQPVENSRGQNSRIESTDW